MTVMSSQNVENQPAEAEATYTEGQPEQVEGQYAEAPAEGEVYAEGQPAEGDPATYAQEQPVEGEVAYEDPNADPNAVPAELSAEEILVEEVPAEEADAPVPEEPPPEEKKKHFTLNFPAGLLEKTTTSPDITIEDEDLRLFDEIIQDAVNTNCADLHLKEGAPIHFRISRGLRDRNFPIPTRRWMEKVIRSMIPPHQIADLEKDREADFSFQNPKYGRFRVSAFSATGKWALAMRYIKSNIPNAQQLGISPLCLTLAEAERGLVLLAGITGSGKSTTMGAMVQHLNVSYRKHIITIEDPVEFIFPDEQCVIEQREVGIDTMSFQRALKSALREDPDVVLVGEMRDQISIQAAVRAADTGTMVLSTVHTTAASTVPGRLLDFYPMEERESVRKSIADVLRGAIAQRMCPKIGGGMVPAQEIMIGTPLVRQKIFDGELNKLHACIEVSKDDGMVTFNQCMYDLVEKGVITKEVAFEKCSNKQQLAMWFQGIKLSSGII